jgi:PHD/YefM family antitoxin component YafN of YafNO toxin-antitoxin module
LTKDGEPVGALVPLEDYEALLETADVLDNEKTLSDLKVALEDEKKGRIWKRDKTGKWIKLKKAS